MRYLVILLILFILPTSIRAEEGDFWRSYEKEENLGWEVIDQDFSHIIYKDKMGYLWTRCHSCPKFLLLKDAHKVIINRSKHSIEPVVVSPEGRILYREELYYCDECYRPEWK